MTSKQQSQTDSTRDDRIDTELNAKTSEKNCYTTISEFTSLHYQCLRSINNYRKSHNIPDVSLSLDCCEHSIERANYVLEANSIETLEAYYGESVYICNDDDIDCSIPSVINGWYLEGKMYNYADPGFNSKTANYTQIIWKNSTHVGCAFLKADGKTIFVVNYFPPGNKRGQFATNVLVPICNEAHIESNDILNESGQGSCSRSLLSQRRLEAPHLTHPVFDESTYNSFQKQILNAHNEVRSFHKSEPLELDLVLCNTAKKLAQVKYLLIICCLASRILSLSFASLDTISVKILASFKYLIL